MKGKSIVKGKDSTVQRTEKGSKSKSVVSCPKVVKLHNDGMGCDDLMDQRTAYFRLDC